MTFLDAPRSSVSTCPWHPFLMFPFTSFIQNSLGYPVLLFPSASQFRIFFNVHSSVIQSTCHIITCVFLLLSTKFSRLSALFPYFDFFFMPNFSRTPFLVSFIYLVSVNGSSFSNNNYN